jgi:tRNASer (uridine44-2'-O)-methyltransferase
MQTPTSCGSTVINKLHLSDASFAPVSECGSAPFALPGEEHWTSILSTPSAFAPEYFLQVMDNLLPNPNLTSTCLFRAEIFYDSARDIGCFDAPADVQQSSLIRHMKVEYQPIPLHQLPARLRLRRTVVRNLIPRNPQLDKPLVQTVHFLQLYSSDDETEVENIVVQIPHVQNLESIPYYHPKVQALAIQHRHDSTTKRGSLSVHYRLFPNFEMTDRLQRTALNLLRIVHKHSTGRQNGYQKRVQLDQIISQKRFQDTYTRLKAKHAKWLMDAWAEVTDPLKHVFEDLGIAAFLIELWKDMYGSKLLLRKKFPGFVDVGCGNGVLVYLLISEGYDGWGFDARRRKSWSTFPEAVQEKLKEMILVPKVLLEAHDDETSKSPLKDLGDDGGIHNGVFPPGTFIISNHADQLTPWTPLLAYASQCPFIALPCCSHSLSGKVTRFYDSPPASKSSNISTSSDKSPECSIDLDRQRNSSSSSKRCSPPPDQTPTQSTQQQQQQSSQQPPRQPPTPQDPIQLNPPTPTTNPTTTTAATTTAAAAAASPPLLPIPRPSIKSQPSAYAGFTAHVMHLATSIGFSPVEHEVLRIPSTRNLCVVGRTPRAEDVEDERWRDVLDVLEKEVDDVGVAAKEWVLGAVGLRRGGVGH